MRIRKARKIRPKREKKVKRQFFYPDLFSVEKSGDWYHLPLF